MCQQNRRRKLNLIVMLRNDAEILVTAEDVLTDATVEVSVADAKVWKTLE